MATEEELEHEDDELVSVEQIVAAVRARLARENLENDDTHVMIYEPIQAIGPGIWVSERHAGTWFLDGYQEDGTTPQIDIDDVSMAPAPGEASLTVSTGSMTPAESIRGELARAIDRARSMGVDFPEISEIYGDEIDKRI